jgi:hypothetical protein
VRHQQKKVKNILTGLSNFEKAGHYLNEIHTFNHYLTSDTMQDFMLIFRQPSYDYSNASPSEMQALAKKWQDWVGGIAAQGKLGSTGMRLSFEGKVLKAGGVITDGPFVEIRERLGSFAVVKAENLEDAVTLAHGCPALDADGSVEIRPIMAYPTPENK